ncbi:MAG: penicillin acylase family protein [Bacteroidota bacterium]
MFKNILKFLFLIVIILAVGFFFFVNNNKPQYDGELNIANLNDKVTVYFDDIGVPHIYAQNQHDAYVALGYVHAQDRLWQMELVRRIAAGRLSEIFGKDMVDTDKFFKGIGIEEAAIRSIQKLDTTTTAYKLTTAYLDGINQFIKNGATPIEFTLIGIEKENYTIKDIYNVFGYMSFGFAQAHKTDPLMTNLKNKLGYHYMVELGLRSEPNTTMIGNFNPDYKTDSKIASAVDDILDNSVVPPFIGSNSWVVGEKKTKNKKVILANDPHIEFSQPAVWYQSHIVTPDFEIYGFNLSLTPFPLLGHNHDYAYGMTMFENDDIDFYTENGEQKYEERNYTIKVKDEEDVELQVKVGKHGPVMNDFIDLIDSEENIAMDWVYTKFDNDMLDVSYKISHANSLSEFKKGVEKIHAPGLNLMYGDAKGNIAWFAAAKLYSRESDVNTKYILESENDKVTYHDFDQNPQAVNPPWNYVYSANNQPKAVNERLYPGYYLPEDRAKRIVDLIQPKDDFTKEEMQEMIMDVTSSVVPKNINTVIENLSKVNLSENEKEAIQILMDWDGDYKSSHTAPTIYNKFIYHFLENTFADEMGEEAFKQFLKTHLYKRQIAMQIQNRKSIWWDDITTKEIKENRDEIFTTSFHEAITALEGQFGENMEEWTWDKALTITHKHTFDKVDALKDFFNVGPFTTDGGNEVINNQLFPLNGSGKYEVRGGPSTRRIVDFSDVENSVAILPTGQSGNVFSKHYDDQAQKYLNGEFVKMMLNKEEIQQSKDKLVLEPVK